MNELKNTFKKYLKKTEVYTKTDMVYLAKGSFWLSFGQGIAMISAFALSIILARALPQETYGTYKFILSIASIIGGLSLSGIGTSLIQAVARGYDGTIFLAFKTQLIWSSLLAGLFALLAFYYILSGNYILGTSLLIAGATSPLVNCFSLYGSFLSGKKDFKRSTLYWISSHIINISTIAIIAITTGSVIALTIGYFISQLITSIVLYYATLRIYKPDIQTAQTEMISYGKHLSVMNIIGTIANQLDKILVFHSVGSAPLAIYSFAFAIPEQFRSFIKNLVSIGVPKFAHHNEIDLRKSIVDKVLRLTFLSALCVIVYWITAPIIFKLLFPTYMSAVWYSQLYMVGLIFFPGISLLSTYFQVSQQTKIQYKLSIMGNTLTILLSIILITQYGTLGAVIENTVSWSGMLILNIFYFIKRGRELSTLSS